jgi:hypothetical protein
LALVGSNFLGNSWVKSGGETVTVDPSYGTGMEALTSSLDRIQRAASQILRAIEAGG